MKVAMLLDSISRKAGGIFDSARGLAIGMAAAGDAVCVHSIEDEFSREDMPAWHGTSVRCHRALGPASFGFAPGLVPSIVQSRPDVLHAHGLWKYLSIAGLRASRTLGCPRVVHTHGMLDSWALQKSRLKKTLARLAYEQRNLSTASCVRALNEAEWRSIRDAGCRSPVAIIPNGVDLPANSSSLSRLVDPLVPGSRVLLYLGRIHPKKGLDVLIDAWSTLVGLPSARAWMLVIAGWDQGGHRDELERRARGLGLKDDRVRFVGPQYGADRDAWYERCEAFVLPSRSEGLPMSVLEAWARSRPVVLTDRCNIPEAAAHEAAIETTATKGGIEEALSALLGMDDVERKAMGAAGRALVEEKFSWPSIAAAMQAVDRWLIEGASSPPCVRLD